MVHVKAPGKMILIGEYAVLEGAPALVAAVDRYAHVSVVPSETQFFYLSVPAVKIDKIAFQLNEANRIVFRTGLTVNQRRFLKLFVHVFEHTYKQLINSYQKKLLPSTFSLCTNDFYNTSLRTKLGFGSSAALTVAVVNAMFRVAATDRHLTLTHEVIFETALRAHRNAQQKIGSGIDIAASSYGGVNRYKVNTVDPNEQAPPEPLVKPQNLSILPVWTGRSASTKKMVQQVNRYKSANTENYQSMISDLGQISAQACADFASGDTAQILAHVRNYNDALKAFGERTGVDIVSEPHRQLARYAVEHAFAYKPSGAGGGDIGLLFSDRTAESEKIKTDIRTMGYTPLEVQIAPESAVTRQKTNEV
ncbi:MAG: hypothetical protein GF313_11590 [Caldithrix sp.]|nr:hypothetical protein [Caldithrix sp.]